MKIYVDADACPVVKLTENIAARHNIPVVLICDTNHILKSDYSDIIITDTSADSADIVLINKCCKGDIVVTQDYGVAAMALGKGAYCIHQGGSIYTNENIDRLLMQRHIAKTVRRKGKNHLKGPKKRTEEDNKKFEEALEGLILNINNQK